MEPAKQEKIKEIINGLLAAMDVGGQVADLEETQGEGLLVKIESPEAGYLIGRGGENLLALQQLSRALVNKKIADAPRLALDVNNYQQSRLEALKEMAQGLAQEAVTQKIPRWLPPMNAYERRVVHLLLVDRPDIKTESEGEGEARRIKIIPA